MNKRMGAHAWTCRTEYDFGMLLLSTGVRTDREKGRTLLSNALKGAKELGMIRLSAQISALLEPSEGSSSPSQGNCFRREGEYWMMTFGGKSVRLRDAKGLAYIAHLLRHPGTSIHVAELLALEAGTRGMLIPASRVLDPETPLVARGEHAGGLLDPRAKAEYRQRLQDLHSELDESREHGDLGRAETLQAEIEFIEHELRAAYGIGGSSRRGAD
jgi:hypothetical protein